MSVSQVGATSGSSRMVYDFTKVTNAQCKQEIQDLRKRGALSADQSVLAMLDASGGDSVPISGQPSSSSQALSDSTLRDFISVFQLQADWMHSTPGSVGAANVDSLLQALQAYQGKPVGDSSSSVATKA